MATSQDVMCPKCWEHRLLDVIRDARGERMYCKVCAHEFTREEGLNAGVKSESR